MSSWKRPSFLLIAFTVLTALILAGCGAGKSSDKGTIIIGGALCLTGIQAPLDEPAVRGANLAVDEVNKKGGVLGRKIAFLNLDGKSDPVTVGNVAVELIKKGAKAIITPSDFDFGGPASRDPLRERRCAAYRGSGPLPAHSTRHPAWRRPQRH